MENASVAESWQPRHVRLRSCGPSAAMDEMWALIRRGDASGDAGVDPDAPCLV